MPKRLALHLPFLTQEELDALSGSIVISASSPRGSLIHEGVIQGACPYFLLLLVFSLFFLLSIYIRRRDEGYDDCGHCCRRRALRAVLLMPNWYLGIVRMHLTKLIWRGIRLRVSQRNNGLVPVPPLFVLV